MIGRMTGDIVSDKIILLREASPSPEYGAASVFSFDVVLRPSRVESAIPREWHPQHSVALGLAAQTLTSSSRQPSSRARAAHGEGDWGGETCTSTLMLLGSKGLF